MRYRLFTLCFLSLFIVSCQKEVPFVPPSLNAAVYQASLTKAAVTINFSALGTGTFSEVGYLIDTTESFSKPEKTIYEGALDKLVFREEIKLLHQVKKHFIKGYVISDGELYETDVSELLPAHLTVSFENIDNPYDPSAGGREDRVELKLGMNPANEKTAPFVESIDKKQLKVHFNGIALDLSSYSSFNPYITFPEGLASGPLNITYEYKGLSYESTNEFSFTGGKWEIIDTVRAEVTGAFTTDNIIYLFDRDQTNLMRYDPVSKSLITAGPKPLNDLTYNALISTPETAYMGLGYSSANPERGFWKLDPSTETWTDVSDSQAIYNSENAVFEMQTKDRIYIRQKINDIRELWEFTPSTLQWVRKKDMPIRTFGMLVYSAYERHKNYWDANGLVYYIDVDESGEIVLWQYDTDTDEWNFLKELGIDYRSQTNRNNFRCFETKGKYYFVHIDNLRLHAYQFIPENQALIKVNSSQEFMSLLLRSNSSIAFNGETYFFKSNFDGSSTVFRFIPEEDL